MWSHVAATWLYTWMSSAGPNRSRSKCLHRHIIFDEDVFPRMMDDSPLKRGVFGCDTIQTNSQVAIITRVLVTAVFAIFGVAVASRWRDASTDRRWSQSQGQWGLDRGATSLNAPATKRDGDETRAESIVHISHLEDLSGASSTSTLKRRRSGGDGDDMSLMWLSEKDPQYNNREMRLSSRAVNRDDKGIALDNASEAVLAGAGGRVKQGRRILSEQDSLIGEQGGPATRNFLAQPVDDPTMSLGSTAHRRKIGVDGAAPGGEVVKRELATPVVLKRKDWRQYRGAAKKRGFAIPHIMFEHGDLPRRVAPPNHDEFGKACSTREIVGLERCPELEDTIDEMLAAKAAMLRRIVEVLSDPESSGTGGDPEEPLLLVQKLALDETDAIFGAFESTFVNVATDAAGWSPLPGGFNRWVERYHRQVLRRTRPVIVTVHGDDVCALEQELSLEARKANVDISDFGLDEAPQAGHRMPGEGEDFTVPVVLMTLGWDPAGDPTHREDALGRDRSCVFRVLEMKRIVRWFTSHTRYDSHTDSLFHYLPIGFGGYDIRSRLPQKAYVDAARRQLELLEKCPADMNGRYDLLVQCNTLERYPREEIYKLMTEKVSGPVPVNRAPLEPRDMVVAATKGIFAVSPPGTGADCFRHYELVLGGNIVMVPDTYSLRQFLKGLPVLFFGHYDGWDWGDLTCERLLVTAKAIQNALRNDRDGNGERVLQFEKLTHGFWRRYIRAETLRAGGAEKDAPYVERSVVPLNQPGWRTFRRIGCFSRRKIFHQSHFRRTEVTLDETERTPEGCAARCSQESGGVVGFFGISDGNMCWCDSSPGVMALPKIGCRIDCANGKGLNGCGGKGKSTTYVFGPEKRGAHFGYLGCFAKQSHLMFHAKTWLRKTNTPFICEAFCTSLRYPFFALEDSQWCHCGVITSNTPRSVQVPAYLPGKGYVPDMSPPNASHAAKAVPSDVRVGDPRFACQVGRCSGNPLLWGCGGKGVLDLYANLDPCVLFRDC